MFLNKLFPGFFISVIFSLAVQSANSTGLGGTVVDTISALPVEKAKVELNGGEYLCLTDADGRFVFPHLPSGDWVIAVSRMGYKAKSGMRVYVGEGGSQNVQLQLQPAAIILPGQLVTGTRLDYDLFGAPAMILSGDEIRKSGFRDLPQALASLPGITVNTGFSISGTPRVTVRGETSKRLGITMDGLSLAEGIRGEIDLSAIPLAAVENIEVRHGGQWGDAALGGSVNINTRKDFSTARMVSLGYGSFNQRNASAMISGMAGSDYGYLVSGEVTDRGETYDYIDDLGDDATRANAGFQIRKIYGKLGGRLAGDWDWGVSGLHHENHRGMPGTVQYGSPAAETKERRRILAADLSGVYGDRLSVSVRSSIADFRSLYSDTLTFPSHNQYDETSYLLDAALLYRPDVNSPITASIGGELGHRKLKGNDYIAPQPAFDEATRTAKAVWGQVQLRSPADLPTWVGAGHLTGGLRYDADDQTPSYWAPRVGAVWGWGAPRLLNLSAGWGRSFRRALLTSLFWEDAYSRGNPELEPEKAREWDMKIEVIPPKTNLTASTRFFDRAYDGFIEWAPGEDWVWSPVNLPRSTLVGREDGLSWWAFNQCFHIDLFHTLIWATNEGHDYQGKFMLYRPKHSYQVKTRVQNYGFDIRFNARWENRRYINKENTNWLPPYRWFDLVIRKTIPWNTLQPIVSLKCENLTNEAAALHDGYPLPGRSYGVGVELNF
jgi:outer membrane cobalamin receptor